MPTSLLLPSSVFPGSCNKKTFGVFFCLLGLSLGWNEAFMKEIRSNFSLQQELREGSNSIICFCCIQNWVFSTKIHEFLKIKYQRHCYITMKLPSYRAIAKLNRAWPGLVPDSGSLNVTSTGYPQEFGIKVRMGLPLKLNLSKQSIMNLLSRWFWKASRWDQLLSHPIKRTTMLVGATHYSVAL